ncbi:MAG: Cof-type HAD-IIB family hydrolase [Ignavibacteriaceae bacterium]|nr:Cof-type HAD-IIB family hydrolase [Ignavibacteriaceae bacterium]
MDLKEIKHIVTDIDGTLLDDNGELGFESKKLIKELMGVGVIISLATGRLDSAVTDIAKELSLNGYIISLDGAMIKNFVDDKILYESFLKTGKVKKAISISENLLINIVLCHTSTIYYTEHNSVIPSLLSKYGAYYTRVDSYKDYISGTLEIVCSSDIKNSIKQMEEKFNFPYSIGCNTSYFRSKKNENIYYLEIRKAGSSKGKALMRLLKHLSIKQLQTAVIGDWYNDITMFQTKAFKVAVANAIPELINTADFVTTKSNRDDGTAEFFEMVLKSKRD